MNILKEINRIWNFYGFDISDEQQRILLKVRLYNLIGIVLTPTLTFINFNNSNTYNFIASIVIFLSCTIQFILTYVAINKYKNIADKVLYFSYFLYITYSLTNAFLKNFSIESTLVYITILFAITMVINKPKRLYLFLVYNFTLAIPYLFFTENSEISKLVLFCFFIVFYVLGIVVVRGRYETGKKLIERENFLKALFNQSYDAFLLVNFYSKEIVDCNDVAIKLFETENKNQIIGQTRDKFKATPFSKIESINVKNSLQEKGNWSSEEEYVTINGRKFIANVIITTLEVDKSNYYVVRITDITAKKEAEKKLEQSEEKYKNLFERNLAGVYKIRITDKVLLDCNNAFAKILGYTSKNEILGKKSYDLYINSSDKNKFYGRISEKRQISNHESKITLKNGVEIWVIENTTVVVGIDNIDYIEGTIIDITELKNTQQNLQKTEQDRSLLLSSLNVVIYTVLINKKDKYIDFISPQVESVFGYTKEEYNKGKINIKSYYHPDDIDTLTSKMQEIQTTKKQITISYRFYHVKTGKLIWIEESIFPQFNEKGEHVANFGISQDITNRVEKEIEIKESEKRFKLLAEASLEGILIHNQGIMLEVNSRLCEQTGYTKEELIGNNIFNFITKEYKPKVKENIINKEKKPYKIEIINKDGSILLAETQSREIPYADKQVRVAAVRDVSERIQLEKQKIRAEVAEETNKKLNKEIQERFKIQEQLSAIINNTENLIFSIDKNYIVTECNNAFKKIGKEKYNKELYIGINFLKIVDKNRITPFKDVCEKVFKGKTFSEILHTKIKGKKQFFETLYNPIKGINGKITGIAIFSQNITDRKKNEEEIQHALEEKEILLKEVHHRVKNNLQVISSILNLQSSYVQDKNTLQILSESQNRIKSMSFIHESLYQTKDFSNIDFQDYILNLSNNLIHSYQIYDNLVDLSLDVEKVLLVLDQAIPCGLIINELVSNALKYAFNPKQKGIISISLKQQTNNKLTLIIADNGKGLPKDFDFKNSDSLGLQLVNMLTEQIDGKISCDTTKGTQFTIEFKKL